MSELDDLLMGPEPNKHLKVQQGEISELKITNYAYSKACIYAQIACQEQKSTVECGGYLLAKKNESNRIVTDVILAKGQDVTSGTFEISGQDVISSGREIDKLDCKVIGWWHSHGELHTFFSPIDKQGQLTVLNAIAGTNYIVKTKSQEIESIESFYEPETGLITVFDRKKPGRRYEFKQDSFLERPKISSFTIVDEKRIGFSYGLVVNAKTNDPPYAEIAERDFCTHCRKMHDMSFEVEVEIISSEEERFLDRKDMEKDIRERVKFRNFLSMIKQRVFFSNDPFTRRDTFLEKDNRREERTYPSTQLDDKNKKKSFFPEDEDP